MQTEQKRAYEDSADFTAELDKVGDFVWGARDMVNTHRWETWMELTDSNYTTRCVDKQARLRQALKVALKAYDELVEELGKAE